MYRDERNLSMLTDFYELTMMNGYLEKGMEDTVAVFDVFFRRKAFDKVKALKNKAYLSVSDF